MKTGQKKKHIIGQEYDYRFLVDSLEDYGVLMMDTKGRIVSWNEGAQKIFGYKANEVIGKPVSVIFSNADKKLKMPALEIATAISKGRADDERQHRRKDGTLFWATGVMWAIKDDSGKQRGLSKLIRDISKLKAMEDTIRHQSLHDSLTGLPNRRSFEERLVLAIAKAKQNQTMLATMFLDLDNFKKVNDTLGHDTGDILLKEVATRISFILRKGDIICRVGGDEFILLIDSIKDKKDISKVVKKLLAVFTVPFDISNKKIPMSACIGVSFYPQDGKSPRTLEKRADLALYKAKAAGKKSFRLFGEK